MKRLFPHKKIGTQHKDVIMYGCVNSCNMSCSKNCWTCAADWSSADTSTLACER